MVQNPTIFCEVFVTDITTPPFQNKTYSTLRSYPYKILHCIMVLIRWKCLGRCKGIDRAVQEYFKTIDNDNTVWTVLANIQWKSFTKGHPFQARWLKALACDTVHSLHVEMCGRQKPHWYPQTCTPKKSCYDRLLNWIGLYSTPGGRLIQDMLITIRPRPHVSGYFWIRNFFFPNTKISTSTRNVITAYLYRIRPFTRIRIHSGFTEDWQNCPTRHRFVQV